MEHVVAEVSDAEFERLVGGAGESVRWIAKAQMPTQALTTGVAKARLLPQGLTEHGERAITRRPRAGLGTGAEEEGGSGEGHPKVLQGFQCCCARPGMISRQTRIPLGIFNLDGTFSREQGL